MVIFILTIFIKVEIDHNPRVRLMVSIISFSEKTLSSDDYLAHDIDLKDLFRNYTNSDISYSGNAYIKKVEGFPYSISGSISGKRSSENKQLSCEANMNVLVLNVGELDFYANDQTVYVVAPLLGDVSFGFDTGVNLFQKGPDFTKNLNREWFHNNKMNIFNFIRSIEVTETGNTFTDTDGATAEEYLVTIPKGEGDFIWKLLNVDAPDHDINFSIYLDKHCQIRKVVFDLSAKNKGATLSIYGDNCNTLELYVPLPNDESACWTIERNGDVRYTNSFTNNMTYTTADNDIYTVDFDVLMNFADDSISAEAQNITVKENDSVLLEGYCKGKITKEDDLGDFLSDTDYDLSSINVIDWATIREDTAGFIDDIISQARKNTDLFDLFE